MPALQNLLVWLVVSFSIASIVCNVKKIKRGNHRNPLRIMGIIFALYIGGVYFLFGLGAISQTELIPLLRWFWSVIMLYIIVEAQNNG